MPAPEPEPARGRLIALEGIDGSGKSTQARALAAALGARLTHEPGDTSLGARLREILLAPEASGAPGPAPRAEALLMAADRAEHVALVLQPALAAGEWVVTERYSGSTLAYQGWGRGLPVGELASIVSWAAGGLTADLSVLVDVTPEVAAGRLGRRGGADRLERLGPGFAARVREGFLAQAEADPAGWAVVDGTAEVAALSAHILDVVRARLGEPPVSSR
ncbi:MAG TPA: dTMP kinase [Acidimicrobiales bacterium]